MKQLLFHLLTTLIIITTACKNEKPNVLLIVADDLGYTDLVCYGSSFYETPSLDNLAAQGIMFTNAYASCPVCSPTRASIQTGKYPVRVGITDWIQGRASYSDGLATDRRLSAENKYYLDLEEITLAEVFKENGYRTFFAGKWHLGEEENYWPEMQGYDVNKGGYSKGSPNRNSKEGTRGYFSPYGNPRLEDGPEGEYLPERLAIETIQFINESSEEPFFVCLSYYLVHNPLQAKDEDIIKYEKKRGLMGIDSQLEQITGEGWMEFATGGANRYRERIIQGNPIYAGMVEALDRSIGSVMEELERLDLDENTIILFTSDNGGLSTSEGSPTSNLPLNKGKGWLYEGGIRVPYILKAPGLKKGIINSMPISSIDILPTLASIAGIKLDNEVGIDGINISPFIVSEKVPERSLFWHYPHYSNQGGNPGSAIRKGDYKLIHDFETGQNELYNLDLDIGERNNIAENNKELVQELYMELDRWRTNNNAKMMEANPSWNVKEGR